MAVYSFIIMTLEKRKFKRFYGDLHAIEATVSEKKPQKDSRL